MTNEELIRRYQAQRTARRTVEGIWNEVTRFVFPYEGDMFRDFTSEGSVDWRENKYAYDSTATYAANTLAASIHGSLTSPSIQWFELRFRQDELNDVSGSKEWLDDTGKRIYDALQESNFNLEANEMYQDLAGYGTSVLVEEDRAAMDFSGVDDRWKGVDFACIPIRECFFESNARGQLHNFWRRREWTALQVVSKFPPGTIPDWVVEKADNAESCNDRINVIFCVWTRDNSAPWMEEPDISKRMPAKNRPYGWKYVIESSKELCGQEGGYYEMPAFLPRWRKMSGSEWGYSPAMLALPDIKTLNTLVELGLSALEKAVDPAILTTEQGLFGDLDLTPGAQNVVRDIGNVVPFESNSNFQAEYAKEQDLRRSIREAFHADDLQLKESPAMTATEVQARMELMQRLLGPTLGRLQSDFLDPLIERTFSILLRAGQLMEMPEGMEGAELDISYVGALTRAQSGDKMASIERWINGVIGVAEFFPTILDTVDSDELSRVPADSLAVPAKLIRSIDDVDKLRQERAKKEEEAQKMQQGMAASEMVKNVGGPEGAAQMQEQMQGGGGGMPGMQEMLQ